MSMRYDDVLIDSRRSPYTVFENLWALGHVVNHPPAHDRSTPDNEKSTTDSESLNSRRGGPNCVTVPIDYTEAMLSAHPTKDLKSFIPNEYELPPQSWAKNAFDKENTIMNGMGIIALRDVKDEELFYDSRLSPDESGEKSQYQSWYHVWDEEGMKNRWSHDKE